MSTFADADQQRIRRSMFVNGKLACPAAPLRRAKQIADCIGMANTLGRFDPVLDEVHSFVLRISIDRARGDSDRPRPQFQLEHVNRQKTCRARTLEEACAALEMQVNCILDELGLGRLARVRTRKCYRTRGT